MPYINVDEVYILDNTGLQVDQVTDLPYTDAALTDGQKAQARANIAAGGTNPNLFDNPFFGTGEVINQRGLTSGSDLTDNKYFIDRWMTTYSGSGGAQGSWSLGANGVTITPYSGTTGGISQKPSFTPIIGKDYTLSVMLADGTVISGTGTHAASTVTYINDATNNVVAQWMNQYGYFRIRSQSSNALTIRAVKLELGTVSTIANDVPPDYGTELAKCQRYFVRALGDPFGTGYITTAGNNSRITVPVPMTMRATPTVSFSGTFHLRVQGNTLNVTTMSAVSPKNTAGGITLSCSGFSGATTGFCALYADGTSDYIDFSADL